MDNSSLNKSFSIIVPAYNESESIVGAITKDIEVLNRFGYAYELIVVNDGSNDNTLQLLKENYSKEPLVKILSHETNLGLGAAVKTGMRAAGKNAVIVAPVDSPLNEQMFQSFINNYPKADVLVSYRTERKGYTPYMRFNSWLYKKIISLLFNMHLKDYNWIHLYKTEPLRKAGIEIESTGIFMLAEILIKTQRAGLTMVEFPVDHDRRLTGSPSAVKFKVMVRTAKEMFMFFSSNK